MRLAGHLLTGTCLLTLTFQGPEGPKSLCNACGELVPSPSIRSPLTVSALQVCATPSSRPKRPSRQRRRRSRASLSRRSAFPCFHHLRVSAPSFHPCWILSLSAVLVSTGALCKADIKSFQNTYGCFGENERDLCWANESLAGAGGSAAVYIHTCDYPCRVWWRKRKNWI